MTPYLLQRSQDVPQPIEQVFPFFARPENLERITPPRLRFKVITPPPLTTFPGAVFDYVVTVRGIPSRWTTYIALYEPPHRFVDLQLRGPYSYWHHTHTFESIPGGTRLRDEVRYIMPFGPLGKLAHTLFVRGDLAHIFDYRARVIAEEFGRL